MNLEPVTPSEVSLILVKRKKNSLLYLEFASLVDSNIKESTCNKRRPRFIPWVSETPREGNGNPLQYCLESCMDRGAYGLQSMGS